MADNTTLCEPCNKQFLRKCDFTRHLTSNKHKKCIESSQPTVYTCDKCDFSTETLCFWNRHISTKKHITNTIMNGTKLYNCKTCDREDTNYKTHWAHRQKCAVNIFLGHIGDIAEQSSDMRTTMIHQFNKIIRIKRSNKVYNKFDLQFVVDEIYRDYDNMMDVTQHILTLRNEFDNYISDLQSIGLK